MTRLEAVQQSERSGCVMGLPRRQAEAEREALPIDDSIDVGREATLGATQAMILPPILRSQPADAPVSMCCPIFGYRNYELL